MWVKSARPRPLERFPQAAARQGVAEPPEMLLRYRVRATGAERWALLRARPVFDPEGRPRLVIIAWHDVTEQKRAERESRFLAEAGQILAGSLDVEATLAQGTRPAVPTPADLRAL